MNKQEYLKQLEESIRLMSMRPIRAGLAWFGYEKMNKADKDVIKAAQHLAEIIRGVEAGEWNLVPCEATEDMKYRDLFALGMDTKDYKAAIQAAPSKLDELIGGEG